jgi:hypothetical protein
LGKEPRKIHVEQVVFIGLADGGRFKEYADDTEEIIRVYRQPLTACTYEVPPAPEHLR